MKKIIIAEKPSVAQEYAKVLKVNSNANSGYIENDDWIVTWAVGHLVTMSYPEVYDEALKRWSMETLPFLPKQYKYEVIANVKSQFSVVKKLFNRADISTIYYAGDSGREGIYIQMLIRMMAGHKNGIDEKVVWIDSQTEDEIRRGIKEAKDVSYYQKLTDSAYMRAIEDYVTGINFTRALSIKYGAKLNQLAKTEKKPVAVGRVMTCVLGMIVSREKEIVNFNETPFYRIENSFHYGDTDIVGEWKAVESSKYFQNEKLYKENGFKTKEDAELLLQEFQSIGKITIDSIETKVEKKNAPLLFNLAELQNECTKRYKISPDQTLSIAQSLYEKKLTTYPRTDARVLTSSVAKEISKNLLGLSRYEYATEYVKEILDNEWHNNFENTKYVNDKQVTDHYAIIPTGQGTSSISSLSEIEKNIYELIIKRFICTFYPCAEYYKIQVTEKCQNEKFFTGVTALKKAGYLKVIGFENNNKERTLAQIFVTLKKGVEFTSNFEIKEGKTTPPKRYTSGTIILAMENAGNLIEDEELRSQIKNCGIGTSATRSDTIKKLVMNEYIDLHKKTQILRPAPLGEMICEIVESSIPALLIPEFTASWEKGLEGVKNGEITKEIYQQKVEEYVRKELGKIKDNTSNNKYEGGVATQPKETTIKCPKCGNLIVRTKFGYGCSNYKNGCDFTIPGTKVTEDDINQLLNKKFTKKIGGFKSKKGTTFSAILVLNNDLTVSFKRR